MKKLASLFVTFTFGMAGLSMPMLALAQAVSVELGNTGEHTGAGIVVPVTVACVDNSRGADIEVLLVQRPPAVPAVTGEGRLALRCGSTPHTVHVLVRPFGQQFNLGSAFASAFLDACDSTGRNCDHLRNDRNIEIVN
jgi:hypothetical protein